MSQADILLANSEEESSGYAYPMDSSKEEHIVIKPDRYIVVPESLRKIAVQHDHNSETVTFDCPKYWDGVDMSTKKIYINYMRADEVPGSYMCSPDTNGDVVATTDPKDPSMMHFTWKLSGHVTAVNGIISFLVCIKEATNTGKESFHWNTELCQELKISKGFETDEMYSEPQNADVITQILLRMETFEATVDNAVQEANKALKSAGDTLTQVNTLKTQAETAATNAAASASEAATKATQAANSAVEGALGTMNSKLSSAQTAQKAAEAAQGKAEAAQAAAEKAKEEAVASTPEGYEDIAGWVNSVKKENDPTPVPKATADADGYNIADTYLKKVTPIDGQSRVYGIRGNKDVNESDTNGSWQEEVVVKTSVSGKEDYRTIPRREAILPSSAHPGTFEVEDPQMNPKNADGSTNKQYSKKHPMTVGVAEARYAKYTKDGDTITGIEGIDLSNLGGSGGVLKGPVIINQNVGNYKLDQGHPTKTISEDDMTIADFLTGAYMPALEPTVEQPSLSVTELLTQVEVGTEMSPIFMATLKSGSYSYGPDTGVTATKWYATLKKDSESGSTNTFTLEEGCVNTEVIDLTPASGKITMLDGSSYEVYVEVTHSAGVEPYTRDQKETIDTLSIKKGTLSEKVTISSFRNTFYGSVDDFDPNNLNSDYIRGNRTGTASKRFTWDNSNDLRDGAILSITAQAGDNALIWAYPTSKAAFLVAQQFQEYNKLVNDWVDLYELNFAKYEKNIAGASDGFDQAYVVYVFTPASGSFKSEYTVRMILKTN